MWSLVVCALGLHAALTPLQGRDVIRRWSPEYRFYDPSETREETVEHITEFLRVSGQLRHLESLGSGTVVLQHTHQSGLAMFVMDNTSGEWCVLGQLPAPLREEGRWRERTAALKWLRRWTR